MCSVYMYLHFLPYTAIKEEISEIEEGKYTTENNVLKVRPLWAYTRTLVPCGYERVVCVCACMSACYK